MIVCDDPAFVGYLPPKTGCVSIIRALRSTYRCGIAGGDWHAAAPLPNRRDALHFVLARNPFRRAVSYWWHYRSVDLDRRPAPLDDGRGRPPGWPNRKRRRIFEAARDTTFAEFCDHPALRKLFVPCAVWADAMPRVDAVLRTETLADDFARLPFAAGIELPRANVGETGYGDWRSHYEPRSVEIVRAAFRPDFDRFGFSTSIDDV